MRKTALALLCLWTGFLFSYAATSIPKGESFQALEQAIVEGDLATAENLIKADTDLLEQHTDTEFMKGFEGAMVDVNKATPLHMAIVTLNPDMIKLFLQYGADPTLTDDVDWDCIVYAVTYGTPEIIDILMEHDPALLSYRTYGNGASILNYAARIGSLDTVRHLIEKYGLDVTTLDENGKTAVDYATWNDDEAVYQYIVNYSCRQKISKMESLPPLYQAIAKKDLEAVKTYVKENPGSVNELIDVFLPDFFADPDSDASAEYVFCKGLAPLHLALVMQDPEIVRFLLDSGADPRQTDAADIDSAIYAVALSNFECVKILAQSDPDIFTYRTYFLIEITVLHAAAAVCSRETVEYLITECGADPAAKDRAGNTPLYYVGEQSNIEVMEYLASFEE